MSSKFTPSFTSSQSTSSWASCLSPLIIKCYIFTMLPPISTPKMSNYISIWMFSAIRKYKALFPKIIPYNNLGMTS